MRTVETGRRQYRDLRPVDAELCFRQIDDARAMVRHLKIAHPAAADTVDDRIHCAAQRIKAGVMGHTAKPQRIHRAKRSLIENF
jgi:hypothetical protein